MVIPGKPVITVITFTVYAYDWLLSVSEEAVIVSKGGLTWSVTVYFLSRIGLFCTLLFSLIYGGQVLPPFAKQCPPTRIIVSICANIAGDSSGYLFFLRVRAVYMKSRYITLCFGVLWLALVAMHIVPAVSARPTQLPENNYCKLGHAQLPIISIFVYDTLVWIAITRRLAADSWSGSSWRARLFSIIHGEGLYSLSKALMRSGQLYYFTNIIAYFIYLAISLSQIVPAGMAGGSTTAYTAFTNIMACQVFRGVALGSLENTPSQLGLTTAQITAVMQLEPLPSEHVSNRRYDGQY